MPGQMYPVQVFTTNPVTSSRGESSPDERLGNYLRRKVDCPMREAGNVQMSGCSLTRHSRLSIAKTPVLYTRMGKYFVHDCQAFLETQFIRIVFNEKCLSLCLVYGIRRCSRCYRCYVNIFIHGVSYIHSQCPESTPDEARVSPERGLNA